MWDIDTDRSRSYGSKGQGGGERVNVRRGSALKVRRRGRGGAGRRTALMMKGGLGGSIVFGGQHHWHVVSVSYRLCLTHPGNNLVVIPYSVHPISITLKRRRDLTQMRMHDLFRIERNDGFLVRIANLSALRSQLPDMARQGGTGRDRTGQDGTRRDKAMQGGTGRSMAGGGAIVPKSNQPLSTHTSRRVPHLYPDRLP